MARLQNGGAGMSIEELARRAGMSTRNVRAYRTAGILPPPRIDGRTGRYDDGHLRRLAAIARLQRRGWSLAAIRDAFAAWDAGASLENLLGLSAPTRRDWIDDLFDEQPLAAGPDALLPHGVWN
jgi:DNA-binding transcriptional MerR regulator